MNNPKTEYEARLLMDRAFSTEPWALINWEKPSTIIGRLYDKWGELKSIKKKELTPKRVKRVSNYKKVQTKIYNHLATDGVGLAYEVTPEREAAEDNWCGENDEKLLNVC